MEIHTSGNRTSGDRTSGGPPVVLPIAVHIIKDAPKFEKTGDSCKIHTSACIPPCKKPYNPNHILIYC